MLRSHNLWYVQYNLKKFNNQKPNLEIDSEQVQKSNVEVT